MTPDPVAVAEAADVLRTGGLVAFPTETVYGLGARGLDPASVARIFEAKGRPGGHPLILHVDGEEMARGLAAEWSPRAAALAAAFWPGPLTLVVPRAAHVPPEVSGGLATVGLRAPVHPVALALIAAAGEPIAAPSANAHTHVSPTTAEHVVRSLGDRVDLVLDAGPCRHGIESTVVAVGAHDEPLRVLRPGAVTLEALRAIDPHTVDATSTIAEGPRPAPGMAAKHYAPRTRVVLAPRGQVGWTVAEATVPAATNSFRVAAIVATTSGESDAAGCEPLIVLPDEPAGYARGLYSALHEADEAGVDLLVIEAPPDGDVAWWAIADRLRRAAKA
ncbi:MAG: threonylcarbamoyl-AMP synthase [Labilithrix sp.]|nr:threonylcarbamoyl-AMP synthase [Labilithrix sp.]MCW5817315.1 threonylcarbamoyl-AMP synthase [Labilithrix sp.]